MARRADGSRRIVHLLFDLDGTLVDSVPVVGAILEEMRRERGLAPRPAAFYRKVSSLGGAHLVAHALETDPAGARGEVAEFRRRYALLPTPEDCLYPQVRETLEALRLDGFTLAICSNKPMALCEKVLSETGLARHFAIVTGGDSAARPKPHPDPLLLTLERLGAGLRDSLYFGDSTVDEAAAAAAGLPFVFFSGGYDDGVTAERAFLTASRIGDIPGLLRDNPAMGALR